MTATATRAVVARVAGAARQPAVITSALVLVVLFALPVGSVPRMAIARVAGLAATWVYVRRLQHIPEPARRVWMWFGWYLGITAVTDVIYDGLTVLDGEPPFPGVTDVLYMSTYVCAIAGLMRLLRLRSPGRDLEAWIDTAIVAVSASSVAVGWAIGPLLLDATHVDAAMVVSVLYPLLDLVLLAATARTLAVTSVWNRSVAVLAAALACLLVYDLQFNVLSVSSGAVEQRWMEPLWVLGLLLLPAAVTSDDAEHFDATPAGVADRVTPLRGLAIGIAVLVPGIQMRWALWNSDLRLAKMLAPAGFIALVLVVWRMYRLLMTVQAQAVQLQALARTDALTGLPNRRTWDYELARRSEQARANGEHLTIALLDLDHFKRFNDAHGHQSGDVLLREVARAWRASMPEGAILARYGGEEFGLLLPLDATAAQPLLDGLRSRTPESITVSIGAAQLDDTEAAADTVRRADLALFRAKDQGRNCVVIDGVMAD